MIAQSTLISYHTEAFVKTESACTVHEWALKKSFHAVKITFYTALILTEFTVVSWQYFTGAVTEHVY